MNIARYERRIIAYLIDFFLAYGVSFAVYFIVLQFYSWPVLSQFWWIELMATIAYIIGYGLGQVFFNGVTLGSLICRTRVTKINNQPLRYRDTFIRSLTLSLPPMVVINAIYMITVHTERSIPDRLSDTMVVNRFE